MLSAIEEQGKLTEELKEADPGSRDSGSCGRSVPPVSSEDVEPERRSQRKKDWNLWQIMILLQMTKRPLEEDAKAYIV